MVNMVGQIYSPNVHLRVQEKYTKNLGSAYRPLIRALCDLGAGYRSIAVASYTIASPIGACIWGMGTVYVVTYF